MQILTMHLHGWPGWDEVRRCALEDMLLFDRESIPFRGLPIWAIPDLAFRVDPASGWQLVDWKTGQEGPVDMQLALYGLFMRLKRFDGPLSGRVVNLGTAEERCIPIGNDEMRGAVERIRTSVANMRDLLIEGDLERNEALPIERFPAVPDACGYCSFLELCHGSEDRLTDSSS